MLEDINSKKITQRKFSKARFRYTLKINKAKADVSIKTLKSKW
jgi:hypothetical protein